MALKTISSNAEYIKWAEVEADSVIKGFYMETKVGRKYNNNNHYIETTEGKLYGLNGNANLDRAMEQVRPGWYVEITYKGMITLESGNFAGKECHQFEIAYDDERIHPRFSGDPSARKDVEYSNSDAQKTEEKPAPPLASPESSQAQAPAQQAEPEKPAEPVKKRKIF